MMKTNEQLCQYLEKSGFLTSESTSTAFRAVDRANYLPQSLKEIAYCDQPVKGGVFHLSAPCIYASVVEAMEFQVGHSFLNIGSGTGYFSTVVSQLIGKDAINHGCDVSAKVVDFAREQLFNAQLFLKEPVDIDFMVGNGLCLEATAMRYDRIYVSGRLQRDDTRSLDFLQGLLEVGGVLVAPIADELVKITRPPAPAPGGGGRYARQSLAFACFAPLAVPPPPPPPAGGEGAAGGGAAGAAAAGRGGALRFPVKVWSPAEHLLYPAGFRAAVRATLLCAAVSGTEQPVAAGKQPAAAAAAAEAAAAAAAAAPPAARPPPALAAVPADVWREVFAHLRRDDFLGPARRRAAGGGGAAAGAGAAAAAAGGRRPRAASLESLAAVGQAVVGALRGGLAPVPEEEGGALLGRGGGAGAGGAGGRGALGGGGRRPRAASLEGLGVLSSMLGVCAGVANTKLGSCCLVSLACGALVYKLFSDGQQQKRRNGIIPRGEQPRNDEEAQGESQSDEDERSILPSNSPPPVGSV